MSQGKRLAGAQTAVQFISQRSFSEGQVLYDDCDQKRDGGTSGEMFHWVLPLKLC